MMMKRQILRMMALLERHHNGEMTKLVFQVIKDTRQDVAYQASAMIIVTEYCHH